ncbi:recombinase family protein [Wenxinia marina]|uniref:recombinase family protein n=1 Tax=Wenxinia marina TaxID=390641 RepID=UPI00035EEE4C|nr:recombinase family protein [Wenxinia marina]
MAYERVSTARQGRSGLGLEAQRKAIDDYAAGQGATILGRFTEVESGRKNDRPELLRAQDLARLTGATLVIAKLDRLSRNAAFLLTLRDSGVRFVACDMPEANDLTVGIMALVAQQEREAISRRTKEALAAAKARGVTLGNPNGAAALRRTGRGGEALREVVQRNAAEFAQSLGAVLSDVTGDGHTSLREVAAELNRRGIRTRRGGRWQVSNVRNLMMRLRREAG